MKLVIIGNSGSGKTWLANKLSQMHSLPSIHFDEIFWKPGGFDEQRDPKEIFDLINKSKRNASWAAEGVFGRIAEQYLKEADVLLWLDTPLKTCMERLKVRGSESKKHMSREQSEQGLKELLDWASKYQERQNLNSYSGHKKLYDGFAKQKFRLYRENDANELLKSSVMQS